MFEGAIIKDMIHYIYIYTWSHRAEANFQAFHTANTASTARSVCLVSQSYFT